MLGCNDPHIILIKGIEFVAIALFISYSELCNAASQGLLRSIENTMSFITCEGPSSPSLCDTELENDFVQIDGYKKLTLFKRVCKIDRINKQTNEGKIDLYHTQIILLL